jgi:aldehyde:ferredoxin oxidoreductase
MERLFNLREGLTRKDDWLPDQFFDQPTTLGIPGVRGLTIDREKLAGMIDEFYEYHGWDKDGVPRPETLQKLGIDKEPSHML